MSDELQTVLTDEPHGSDAPRSHHMAEGEGTVVDRSEHNISRREIPENVLKVLYRLHRSGYRAYLCGGSVRDLLMGREPKDFDIATDAHPMEVRRLFRNSRIIGRRFRLVHVWFQEMIVEVSTFRREPEKGSDEEDLLVTNDNTFGTPLEDARRRDFTINGLFYNIADFSLIDYVGGLQDLEQKRIRVIGNPDVRFREDPVRMMRAVEFASRLDFTIEPDTWDAIHRHHNEILKASPPRVTEELLELLRRGWSRDAFRLLLDSKLLDPLLPELARPLQQGNVPHFWKMLEVLDRTVQGGSRIPDAVLLGVLLLPMVLEEMEREEHLRGSRMRLGEVLVYIRELIQPVCQRMSLAAGVRHQLEQNIESVWRLIEPPPDRRNMWRFVCRENFGEAFAIFELYALSSGRHVEAYRVWKSFASRVRRGEENPPPPARRRRRRRR